MVDLDGRIFSTLGGKFLDITICMFEVKFNSFNAIFNVCFCLLASVVLRGREETEELGRW